MNRNFRTTGAVLFLAFALLGCEAVNRYIEARKSMSTHAQGLNSETELSDAYILQRAGHTLQLYGDSISEASKDAMTISKNLDRVPRDEQIKLRQLFNPEDYRALQGELAGVHSFEERMNRACAEPGLSSASQAVCVAASRKQREIADTENSLKKSYEDILNRI